jgi:hypothetical protein
MIERPAIPPKPPRKKNNLTLEIIEKGGFSPVEVDLFRQWFDAVQDLNPDYLEKKDYQLAEKLYTVLYLQVPNSIKEKV